MPQNSSPPTGSGWLIGLFLATFAIGTDDFIIAGILPAVSNDLAVTEAAAGQLVTAFSLTYAVAAPVLAVATARLPRKILVVGGLGLFALVNLAGAFAPSYAALMGCRVLAALVAAGVGPAAFAVAAGLSAPERVGRSLGTVAAGLTASLVVGVPVGSLLSTLFGWRSTFVAVALLAGVAAAITAGTLPRIPSIPLVGVRTRLALLGRPAVLLGVLGTVLGAGAGLMTYTYIAPITNDLTGTGTSFVPLFIVLMGVSGAVGTVLGGRLTDGWGTDRAVLATFGGVLVATAGLAVVGQVSEGDAPVWVVSAFLVLWGLSAWGNNPPMTSRALRMAGDAGHEAVALNTSGLYLGVALAGAIGGGALSTGGGTAVLAVAAGIGLITVVVMTTAVRLHPSRPGGRAQNNVADRG